jgi:hypothetical protein
MKTGEGMDEGGGVGEGEGMEGHMRDWIKRSDTNGRSSSSS